MVMEMSTGKLIEDEFGAFEDEVLNAEWFATIQQAQVVINTWLRQYNHIRPHHALGMRPPVPETILEKRQISGSE